MKAKVWNDNDYVYKEYFKGDNIVIPPKSFIEMDYDEAVMFRGTFNSIVRDADGQPKRESYKMIRIEKPQGADEVQTKVDPNKCIACGKGFSNQGALAQHVFDEHPESMASESRDEAVANLNKMKAQTGRGK
tara:strand:- start:19733 stop:20128 length:396 start_codon:yes stop_codon:yes gene_type:complete